MCTGRVDLSFPIRAFLNGADGVFIGGCWPGECHYVTEGNYDALGNVHLLHMMMQHVGIDPQRLRLEWISASEGSRFAEIMDDFSKQLYAMGPVGQAEGFDPDTTARRLQSIDKLIPYVRLVERERLRIPEKTEEAYNAFFQSDDTKRLFDELIADRLTTGQIVSLLGERPRTTLEISDALGLSPSDVARHVKSSSRQGLVRYDTQLERYALC